ncbi:hypothetical protein [Peptococcus simiae]|uniref:hypothetical protein n=1 Tax=Peptococcus simiae TaxID=1643805 RepID=UPI0039818363
MKTLEIKKSSLEFEIAGTCYTVDLADDKIKAYLEFLEEITADGQALANRQDAAVMEEGRDLIMKAFDLFFGQGCGKSLYDLCGQSSYVALDLLAQVVSELTEHIGDTASARFNKYLGK